MAINCKFLSSYPTERPLILGHGLHEAMLPYAEMMKSVYYHDGTIGDQALPSTVVVGGPKKYWHHPCNHSFKMCHAFFAGVLAALVLVMLKIMFVRIVRRIRRRRQGMVALSEEDGVVGEGRRRWFGRRGRCGRARAMQCSCGGAGLAKGPDAQSVNGESEKPAANNPGEKVRAAYTSD
jgi:hypothetical protein